jgi:hypothetical protein
LPYDEHGFPFLPEIVLLTGSFLYTVRMVGVLYHPLFSDDFLLFLRLALLELAMLDLHADAGHEAEISENEPERKKEQCGLKN